MLVDAPVAPGTPLTLLALLALLARSGRRGRDGPDGPFGRPHGPACASATNMALVNVLADVISPEELAVWRSLQRAQVTIMRRIECELLERHDLPHASFDVLQQLAQTAGQRLRMNDLADRVLLSRSGLTRLVDRLEREGLVERHACASDARGLFAVLTSAGRRRLEDATPTYHRCIRECFLDLLGPDELRQVAATASKLAE